MIINITAVATLKEIFLKLDPTQIPDFGEGDALKDRGKRRPSTEGGPGHKKPRNVDKMDDRNNAKEDDKDDDNAETKKSDNDDVKHLDSTTEKKPSEVTDEEISNIEIQVQQNYMNNKFPAPPELEKTEYPPWWNETVREFENKLFYFQIFKPTFDQPMRNLPVGKACIFRSYKENYVLLYRKENSQMVAYVAAHTTDPDSTKEIAFTAAQCCRDTTSSSVTLQGFFCDDREKDANPFFILMVKLAGLVHDQKPEEWTYDYKSFDGQLTDEGFKAVNFTGSSFKKFESKKFS
uniref:Uncharacterized protein n=1 Tax=Panagrolaimus superbus TaxID=310955 RepID=A0A914YBF9_9BILA